MIEIADSTSVPREDTRGERGRSAARGVEHTSRRSDSRTVRRELTARDREDGADEVGERRRALESSEYAAATRGASRGMEDSSVWWC
jgi:hypothetical protein